MFYTLPKVRTKYEIFNTRFKGPKLWKSQLGKIWKPSLFQTFRHKSRHKFHSWYFKIVSNFNHLKRLVKLWKTILKYHEWYNITANHTITYTKVILSAPSADHISRKERVITYIPFCCGLFPHWDILPWLRQPAALTCLNIAFQVSQTLCKWKKISKHLNTMYVNWFRIISELFFLLLFFFFVFCVFKWTRLHSRLVRLGKFIQIENENKLL